MSFAFCAIYHYKRLDYIFFLTERVLFFFFSFCIPVGFDTSYFIFVFFFIRGLPAPEAEMLYMQDVEKMEGYGQESFQAKVSL